MKRLAGILAIGGSLILIQWVTSPSARPASADPQISSAELEHADQTAQAISPITTEVDDQAARLRARLAQPPPKPQPARNPFAFGRAVPVAPVAERARPREVLLPGNVERVYVPPPIALPSLVAITSDAQDGGLMRTAVLSMGDEMKIVKPGQAFDRFIVEAIGPDSVRIVDITSPTRATFTVAIR